MLQLGETAERHRLIIQQILLWTERQPFLTEKVCDIIVNAPAIPAGKEADTVKELVQARLIRNWHTGVAAKHLQKISDAILGSSRRTELLELYRQILQSEDQRANDIPEQQELIRPGLVALREGRLGVANRIYREVFNLDWVSSELAKPNRQSPSEALGSGEITTGRLPKLASAVALGIFFVGAVFYRGLQETQPPPSSLPEVCRRFDGDRAEHIDKLDRLKSDIGERFPEICQSKLDNLRYRYAIDILAGRYVELKKAGKMLCQVTEAYYEGIRQSLDRQYFRDWSETSEDFQDWLNEELDTDSCPAYKYLN